MDDIRVTPKVVPASPSTEEPTTPAVGTPDLPQTNSAADETIVRMELAQYLGVRDYSNDKFKFVYDTLAKNGTSKGDVFSQIRGLETKLGLPRYGLGESRLGLLFNYLRTESIVNSNKKLLDSLL